MTSRPRILFRVDANRRIGTGHLYECLWFARGIPADSFFCVRAYPKIKNVLDACGFPVCLIPQKKQNTAGEFAIVNDFIRRVNPDVVIFDMPLLTAAYRGRVKVGSSRVALFNAFSRTLAADLYLPILLVPPPGRGSAFGARHALVRPSPVFDHPRSVRRRPQKVLILFGGADPGNFTAKTLRALARLPGNFSVTVILGWAFPFFSQVRSLLKTFPKPHRLFSDISDHHFLFRIMREHDLAVASGGYTLSELLRLGVPCIALSQNRIEEKSIFPIFPASAFMNLGRGKSVSVPRLSARVGELMDDFDKRRAMSRSGRRAVDGKGIERVFNVIRRLLKDRPRRFFKR